MKKSHKLAALLITGTLLFGCSAVKKNKQNTQPVAETKKETEKKEDSRKEDTKKQEQENISPEKKKQENIKKTEQKKTISQKTQPINNTKKEKKKTENTPKNKIIPNNIITLFVCLVIIIPFFYSLNVFHKKKCSLIKILFQSTYLFLLKLISSYW